MGIKLAQSTTAIQGDNVGVLHLADPQNMYEIQRLNNFEFLIPSLEGIVSLDNTQFAQPDQAIRLSVTQAFIPHFKQNPIEIKRGNATFKYAGTPSFESGQLELNDYIGLETKEILMAWQALSYNVRTQKVGLAIDYKKQCFLQEFSPDYQLVRQWILTGCWISGLSEAAPNSENNQKQLITATIEYDWADLDNSVNAA